MRIYISSPGEKEKNIVIPTRLLFNSITAMIGAKVMKKHVKDNLIDARDLRRFMRVIHRMKRKHKNMKLIEVRSADGEIVEISL